jgi:Flp pilus assembly protein TadG
MQSRRQRGVAIVEFALVLPLLLVLSFITTEFGRALYQYNSVAKSVRDAARFLSTQTPGSAAAITTAQNLVVYGRPAPRPADPPIAQGLTAAMVETPVWQTAGVDPVINTVTVRVTGYSFQSIFTSAFGLNFGTVPFSDITATMRSHL